MKWYILSRLCPIVSVFIRCSLTFLIENRPKMIEKLCSFFLDICSYIISSSLERPTPFLESFCNSVHYCVTCIILFLFLKAFNSLFLTRESVYFSACMSASPFCFFSGALFILNSL
ncbi:unnamed protein product [Moneuplotes crassus]|uniref:Uncharacterized protein n=1 Tax=Euplotes crassus TaxID=5936 RepID=A0AAD1XQM5_EUPCR|nr:unnamed protein product [Moneuplotes crassus]